MHWYKTFNAEYGLYDGPIDGWFAIYNRKSLALCSHIKPTRYFNLGCAIKEHLNSIGQFALLCTKMKVFHVTDAAYVAHYKMLESEIEKYRQLGRNEQVERYNAARGTIPSAQELSERVQRIRTSLSSSPENPNR